MDIKKVIKDRGFTINQVADMMGKNRVTLFQTISRNPTVETLQKIADTIGCRVGDFFRDEIDTFACPNCGKKFRIVPIDEDDSTPGHKPHQAETPELNHDDGTQYRYKNPRSQSERMAILELQTKPGNDGMCSVRNINPSDSDGSEVFDIEFDRIIPIDA